MATMPRPDRATPLYSSLDYGSFRPLSLDDAQVSLWQSMKGAFATAWNMSPTQSVMDTVEIRGDQFFADAFSSTVNDADIVNDIAAGNETPFDPPAPMPLEAQRRLIGEEGLEGALEPDPMDNERGLALKIARKKTERVRQALEAKAPGWHTPFSLAAGFAGGMIDPINIAACFVPVVGEERVLNMLGQAASAWGRAGVRARVGALSGAAGAALVEPIVYGNQMELGQDYGMVHSLMNVGAGAVLGAALGPVAGHVGEWWRNRKGVEHPWSYAPETDESRTLMLDHARHMEAALWHTAMTPEERLASVMDAARAYDQFARRVARANGQDIGDVYGAWRLDYQAGQWRLADRRAPFSGGVDDFFGGMARHWDDLDVAAHALSPIGAAELGEVDSFFGGMARTWDEITAREAAARAPSEPGPLDDFYGNVGRAFETGAEETRPLAVIEFDPAVAGDDVLYMARHRSPASLRKEKTSPDGPADYGLDRHPQGDESHAPHGDASRMNRSEISVNSRTDAAAGVNDPPVLNQLDAGGEPQAQVQFFEDARAMVTFFRAADIDSAPHEIFQIIRRRLGEEARQPGSPLAREYAALERAFGVDGGQWTRAQEESFAEAMLGILRHESKPNPALAALTGLYRERLFEMYCEADAAHIPISPAMRELFNGMMTTSPEEGRRLLHTRLADLATRRWEQTLVDPSLSPDLPAPGRGRETASLHEDLAASRRQTDAFLDNAPPDLHAIRDQIRLERDQAMADLDRQLSGLPAEQKLMEDVLGCYYGAPGA